jgi:hypothetical protein
VSTNSRRWRRTPRPQDSLYVGCYSNSNNSRRIHPEITCLLIAPRRRMQRPRNALVELHAHAHVRALLPGETAVSTSNKLFRENRSPVLIHKLACCAPPRLLPTALPSLHFPNKTASTYAQRAGLNLDQMQTRARTHASSYTLQTHTHACHGHKHMTWCILTNSSETTASPHILTYRTPAPSRLSRGGPLLRLRGRRTHTRRRVTRQPCTHTS